MKLDMVVEILQVGLVGFSFLLALLAYKLIAREQDQQAPRQAILRSARNYFYLCILLAVINGMFQVIDNNWYNRDEEEIAACRDSLDLLKERVARAETLEQVRLAVSQHEGKCDELLKQLDSRK